MGKWIFLLISSVLFSFQLQSKTNNQECIEWLNRMKHPVIKDSILKVHSRLPEKFDQIICKTYFTTTNNKVSAFYAAPYGRPVIYFNEYFLNSFSDFDNWATWSEQEILGLINYEENANKDLFPQVVINYSQTKENSSEFTNKEENITLNHVDFVMLHELGHVLFYGMTKQDQERWNNLYSHNQSIFFEMYQIPEICSYCKNIDPYSTSNIFSLYSGLELESVPTIYSLNGSQEEFAEVFSIVLAQRYFNVNEINYYISENAKIDSLETINKKSYYIKMHTFNLLVQKYLNKEI